MYGNLIHDFQTVRLFSLFGLIWSLQSRVHSHLLLVHPWFKRVHPQLVH